jgi:hypothetical protein
LSCGNTTARTILRASWLPLVDHSTSRDYWGLDLAAVAEVTGTSHCNDYVDGARIGSPLEHSRRHRRRRGPGLRPHPGLLDPSCDGGRELGEGSVDPWPRTSPSASASASAGRCSQPPPPAS